MQDLNRRKFLKTSTALGAVGLMASSPLSALAKHSTSKLTILHTNDWHSRIEPFEKDGGSYSGLGGAAARAAMISKIRSEEEYVLLLDSGDIFQGTPYFNYFKGELEYKLMSQMGYDCVTLGNHDFDNGIDGIIAQLPHATFSFVNCNYDFTGTALKNIVKPYRIFKKGDIKIGVFGVGIELKGLVPDALFGNIKYNDPIFHANEIATTLKKEEKCDLIICLSHLGYEYKNAKVSDLVFAKQTLNIDLILGGHTHTFLESPVTVKNKLGNDVTINQVGWAGIKLGRIDYTLNPFTGKELTQLESALTISV